MLDPNIYLKVDPPEAIEPSNGPDVYIERILDAGGEVVVSEESVLTVPEMKVLILGALGKSVSETARQLHMTPNTVKTQRSRIFGKLDASGMETSVDTAFQDEIWSVTVPGQPVTVTDREHEVLGLFSDGHSEAEAADILEISPHTVNTHSDNLLVKLSARNRAHAVFLGYVRGLLTDTSAG